MASNDLPICWICREEIGDDGITACACDGEMGHVHPQCLNQWLTVSRNTACQLCRVVYNTRVTINPLRNLVFCPEEMDLHEVCQLIFISVGLPVVLVCMMLTFGYLFSTIQSSNANQITQESLLSYCLFFVGFQLVCTFLLGGIIQVTRPAGRLCMAANTRVTALPYRCGPMRRWQGQDAVTVDDELEDLAGDPGPGAQDPEQDSSTDISPEEDEGGSEGCNRTPDGAEPE
ncbi:E3 ubiquitin ligase MIR1 [Colobine gammaherpesvirus 1]|uniref:E3 ubiquitin ligase MIR1 n=1 Tax=Colobine gammaherpesvirus 1 TaxID=2597325 RepID=A0A5B8G6I1_9GAMA|nr:E3 ubiquitin ligase MIR1 [Colobine gammaherpesvirus 1]QDQ69219.1 E3 ubiquitin ligase MIR1 [Colobine gammaherpesvirus 1]